MDRIVYVNGEYVPESEAKISVFDRGFLFADGVYEVTSVLGGKLIDFAGHAARLRRSLAELEMDTPVDENTFWAVSLKTRPQGQRPRHWAAIFAMQGTSTHPQKFRSTRARIWDDPACYA